MLYPWGGKTARAEAKTMGRLWGFLITLGVILAVLLFQRIASWRNRKNPDTCIGAVVVDRRAVSYRSQSRYGNHRVGEYYITFCPVDGGEPLEFSMSETEYDAYHLGDRGPLTYRTWEFISFRPERREERECSVPVAFAEDE